MFEYELTPLAVGSCCESGCAPYMLRVREARELPDIVGFIPEGQSPGSVLVSEVFGWTRFRERKEWIRWVHWFWTMTLMV